MRQIKFRAWDKKDKVMRFYPKWSTLHSRTVLYFAEENDSYVDENDNDDRVELMQFTGLTDTDGKEIYEGDVVEWNIYPITSPKRIRDVVSFGTGCFTVENLGEILGIKEPHRRLRVIGNIYESPELLKP
jgi:uncharacterized phage protein (TIGR01671 family)